MMDPRWLSDLAAYSAQVACVATLGALPVVLRVSRPALRYGYFRLLLALILVLPLVQRREPLPIVGHAPEWGVSSVISYAAASANSASQPAFPWLQLLGIVIGIGIVTRAIWIAAGLVRLGRLRSAGTSVPSIPGDDVQRALATRAEVRLVTDLRQPVTFGYWRPFVLLPESVLSSPIHVQRAVLTHELLHVQRRDWVWLLFEEAVRALFWFHPAVWWLISRIQLAREELVDELAVRATGSRRAYIEALALFADPPSRGRSGEASTPLVPAAGFARRRQLFRRMQLISREAQMSSRRIVWSCAVMALVVAAGSRYAVDSFPLPAAAQQRVLTQIGTLEKQAKPITPENPVPRRTYSVDPVYPAEAAAVDANAMVTVMITLDESGRVAEVRRLGVAPAGRAGAPPAAPDQQALASAFDALIRAAADAVGQWQYEPPANAPLSIRVTFAFPSTGAPRLVAHDGWSAAYAGRLGAPPPPPPPPPPSAQNRSPAMWAGDAIRVGGDVLQPVKTKHVSPIYPQVARDSGVQGVVIIEARIGIDGKISNARVLRSVPLLDQAALDAVMQWEFTPTRLNGQLVPVIMTMTVQFTLT